MCGFRVLFLFIVKRNASWNTIEIVGVSKSPRCLTFAQTRYAVDFTITRYNLIEDACTSGRAFSIYKYYLAIYGDFEGDLQMVITG